MSKKELVDKVAAILDAEATPPMRVRQTVQEILKDKDNLGRAYDSLYGTTIVSMDSFVRDLADKRKARK